MCDIFDWILNFKLPLMLYHQSPPKNIYFKAAINVLSLVFDGFFSNTVCINLLNFIFLVLLLY